MSYVYQSVMGEPQPTWTVGFHRPDGAWITDSDHVSREAAATRCHWLNGGNSTVATSELLEAIIETGGMAITPELAKLHARSDAAHEAETIELDHPDEARIREEVAASLERVRVQQQRAANPDGMTDAEGAMQASRDRERQGGPGPEYRPPGGC